MTVAATQRQSLIRMAHGLTYETVQGTDIAAPDTDIVYGTEFMEPQFLKYPYAFEVTGANLQGNEFNMRSDRVPAAAELSLNLPVTKHTLALVLPFAFGQVTSGGAGPFTHKCQLQAQGAMKSTTMMFGGVDGSKIRVAGMVCRDFTLTIPGSGGERAMIQSNWWGYGITQDITFTWPAIEQDSPFRGGGLTFTIGAAATPTAVDLKSRIRGATLKVDNAVLDPFRPGAAMAPAIYETGERKISLSVSLLDDGTDDILDYLINQTLLGCVIGLTNVSGADSVSIPIKQMYMPQMTNKTDNGAIAKDLTFEPVFRAFNNAGSAEDGYDTEPGGIEATISVTTDYTPKLPLTEET